MIEKSKKFSIGERNFIANFPNCGQIIDIESLKQTLTSGKYGEMVQSGVRSMYYALDIVDTISFMKVCVPEVAKYYNIRNYTELSPEKMNDLVFVYTNEIKPWIDNVLTELRNASVENGTTKNEESVE